MGRLEGKVTVITGAASGIARAAAGAFVQEGAIVGLLDRNAAGLEEVAAELGVCAFPLVADVTDEASVAAAFDQVRQRYDRFDCLYTCAAVQLIGQDAPVHELDTAIWDQTYAINARGVFLSCKYGARLMIDAGNGGSIINAGSPTGSTMAGAGWSAYSSSKASVMGLTRVMAADLAQYGIRCNSIVPGSITTPLTRALHEDPVERPKFVAQHPIGRLGLPEDLTGIAVFLASDESTFATGALFFVDGGISHR